MAKITRRQLKQIIQEEIQNTVIDEGFVDTFKMLGGDLKKWYKSAEQRGDVSASERASDKVIQATIQSLEDNLNKLRSKYGMEGEKGTEAIRQRMGELKVQIATLGKKGEAADDVIDAIADASDGDLELPNVIQMAKDLRAKVDAMGEPDGEGDDAEETPEVAPAVKKAAIAVPNDVLQVVIDFLGQHSDYQNIKLVDLKDKMDKEEGLYKLDRMGRRLAIHTKKAQVAEGKTTITRQTLKEVLSLLTENGL